MEAFVSVEITVTDGYGFTRRELRQVLMTGLEQDPNRLAAEELGAAVLRVLYQAQECQLARMAPLRELPRKEKKEKKKLLRKGMGKILGGAAVVVGDAAAFMAAPAFATSVVAGGLSILNGLEDLEPDSGPDSSER